MQRVDPEDLFRKLADIDDAPGGEVPSDEVLLALAAGELAEAEAERAAAAIAGSPAARERLAALTGVTLPEPRPRTRRRVFAALAEEGRPRPRAVRGWAWGLAAAALLMAIAWPFLRSAWRPDPGPRLAAYDGTIAGLREVRSGETATGQLAFAELETLVSIEVFPVEAAHPDPRFSLYRQDGDHLERVAARWRHRRGGGVLALPAQALVGDVPGDYRLFAVVSRPGDPLPRRIPIAAGGTPQAALAGGEEQGRQVISLQLKLLEP